MTTKRITSGDESKQRKGLLGSLGRGIRLRQGRTINEGCICSDGVLRSNAWP